MNIMKKREILLVLLNEFADWECAFIAPCINKGVMPDSKVEYKIKTVSFSKAPVVSIGGLTILPDYDPSSVPEDFAGIILVGGDEWFSEEASFVEALVKKALKDNKVVGGICNGSIYLGMIGALNDVKHTSNGLKTLKEHAKNMYTGENNYIPRKVVRDKNIVTANGTQFLEFCREILVALSADTPIRIEECYKFFKEDGISKRVE